MAIDDKEIERLRNSLVIEGTRIGIWDWNIQTGETYFNERWAEIIGYTLDELHPVSIDTWIKYAHPDDLELSNDLLQAHFRGETEYYDIHTRMKHKNGEWIWVHDRGKVFEWDNEGKPLRMCGSHIDITPIKRRKKELENATTKLQTVFNLIDVGITITDENGHIIDCNPASERMLGITKQEHLERNYDGKEWEIVNRDFVQIPAEEYASVRALTNNETVLDQVLGVIKNNGEIIWLSVNATPLNIEGYGVLVAYIDITSKINDAQQLKEANRTKDRFFSIIAHDIRSPLTGIMGLSELAELSLREKETETAQSYIGLINKSATEGSELLNNILNWSRVQSNRIEFHARKFNLSESIERILDLYQANLKQKDLTVKKLYSVNVKVYADDFMVDTVLRNLISNAIKFSNSGDSISISTKEVDNTVEVAITDTGTGITQNVLDDLFSLKNTTSTLGTAGEKGTGLGLVLCNDFISLNGGRIWVESEPGKGSSFYFNLPT